MYKTTLLTSLILFVFSFGFSDAAAPRTAAQERGTLSIQDFASPVGDGSTDDTTALQKALTHCSDIGLTCVIPSGKSYKYTRPIFLWGRGSLRSADSTSKLIVATADAPYTFHIGIRSANPTDLNQRPTPWNGVISANFVAGDEGDPAEVVAPRILFFWRVNGGRVDGSTFDVRDSNYGPMSSGNNNNFVINCSGTATTSLAGNCVRYNITISNNTVQGNAVGNEDDNEGFALNLFHTVVFEGNTVTGIGDDMIACHFCNTVVIRDNTISSLDGGIFLSSPQNVTVTGNTASRTASVVDGSWAAGQALIRVDFESTASSTTQNAPKDVTISDNILLYPAGAIDVGGAIYVRAPRNIVITRNTFVNHSTLVRGVRFLAAQFTGGAVWTDPTGLDTGGANGVGRVHSITIDGNNFNAGSVHSTVDEQLVTNCTTTYFLHTPPSSDVTITNNTYGGATLACSAVGSGNVTE